MLTVVKPAAVPARTLLRLGAVLAIAATLLAGVLGGLQRAGWAPLPAATAQAALQHAALMIGGWLGTVIALERAVALKTTLARAVPWCSAPAAIGLMAGAAVLGAGLLWLAATLYVASSWQLWQRQRSAHVVVMSLAALSWWAGNTRFLMAGASADLSTLAAWFTFLVLTIAAERLDLTRLTQRSALAQRLFHAVVALLCAGVLVGFVDERPGGTLVGAAWLALAAWLAHYDIARITLARPGLPRYMALALLAGYAWLAVGGIAWAALAWGAPVRDAAFHAVGLGFVLSMVMAHAPVILPAVAGVRLRFGLAFYLPLVALHATLLWRLLAAPTSGALANALALLWFALTVLGAVLAARQPPLNVASR